MIVPIPKDVLAHLWSLAGTIERKVFSRATIVKEALQGGHLDIADRYVVCEVLNFALKKITLRPSRHPVRRQTKGQSSFYGDTQLCYETEPSRKHGVIWLLLLHWRIRRWNKELKKKVMIKNAILLPWVKGRTQFYYFVPMPPCIYMTGHIEIICRLIDTQRKCLLYIEVWRTPMQHLMEGWVWAKRAGFICTVAMKNLFHFVLWMEHCVVSQSEFIQFSLGKYTQHCSMNALYATGRCRNKLLLS